MPLNFFRVKKWSALFLVGILPVILFIIFIDAGYGLLMSAMGSLVMAIIGIPIFSLIVRHPLLKLIEGGGLLVMTFDSTGVIDTFLAQVRPPFVRSTYHNEPADSLYDRDTVWYMKMPKKATLRNVKTDDPNEITMELKYKKADETKITYAFGSLPCLIWNKNMQTFMSKDSLAKMEVESVIKHLVIYLKKKTEELTSVLRDFARYVVETTKPQKPRSIFSNWIFWVAIIIAIVIIAYLFLPQIESTVQTTHISIPSLPSIPTGITNRT
jgi:hypothetical protein